MRRADWISDPTPRRLELLPNFGRLKSLWMTLFCEQASMAYQSADQITSHLRDNATLPTLRQCCSAVGIILPPMSKS